LGLLLSLAMSLKQTAFSLLLAGACAVSASAAETARSFVQVTILGSNPSKGTLTFLDASGRQRVERATGEALQALALVRAGDRAILSMTSDAGSPVVVKIRRSRPAEPAAQVADAAVPADAVPVTSVVSGASPSGRRSWPNPYAKGGRPAR
jgi:hypothetical protein